MHNIIQITSLVYIKQVKLYKSADYSIIMIIMAETDIMNKY